ncbi:MAG: RNA 2',3'-cyclic phosphodiesterase [Thermoplasmata archaeon]|jgi:2'-5' RNA ligase
MRAFVAIDIPRSTPNDEVGRTRAPPEHLTLHFFADLRADLVPTVVELMSEIARETEPFSLTIAGVGAFPSERNPKVVWRGITDGREALVDLVARLDRRLVAIGLPMEARPFVPHLTWFRVRSDRERALARDVLAGTVVSPPLSIAVGSIGLKESTLTRDGPVHRTIANLPLGARSGSV